MFRRLCIWLVLGLLLALPLLAQEVPPPLQDWQAWVLHDRPEHACPVVSNAAPGRDSYRWAWPGKLTLDARADGARFTLGVRVDAPSWVALPGGLTYWPQQVSVNGQLATVLQHAHEPMLWLAPGDYQVRGTLPWAVRPTRLQIPASIGVLELSVDGAQVERVERNDDGLTLGEAAAMQRAADTLSLRVYRRLSEGLPAMLETHLQFNVTGSARGQLVRPVLPAGFVATVIAGDLSARMERDGRSRVQLPPGRRLLVLSVLALVVLVGAVPHGLLGLPDMHVAGNGSSAPDLRWFGDQSSGALPVVGALSVSFWCYKLAMLAWALSLAKALLGWLRWAFAAWSAGGYWRQREVKGVNRPPLLPVTASGNEEPSRHA